MSEVLRFAQSANVVSGSRTAQGIFLSECSRVDEMPPKKKVFGDTANMKLKQAIEVIQERQGN